MDETKLKITKKIEQAKKDVKRLEETKKELIELNSYKISTNTAFLQNIELDKKFEGFGDFPDWLKIKHEQHWEGKNDSAVEVTFKIKEKKE